MTSHEGKKYLYESHYVFQQAGQRGCGIAVRAEIQP